MRDHYLQLLRYMEWANARILAAVQAAPSPEDLRALNHIAGAQSIWLTRVDPQFTTEFGIHDEHPLDRCGAELQRSALGWIRYVEAQEDASLSLRVAYANLRGDRWNDCQRDIVAHVVNHSTHHRGQIASRLRQAGHTPPVTDYIAWVRMQDGS